MASGSGAWNPSGPVPRAIAAIKRRAPSLVVTADVCLCEYTSHGHCGIVVDGEVHKDLYGLRPGMYREARAQIEQRGATVERIDIQDFMFNKPLPSPLGWTQLNAHGVNNVRDVTMIHGNYIVEATTVRQRA